MVTVLDVSGIDKTFTTSSVCFAYNPVVVFPYFYTHPFSSMGTINHCSRPNWRSNEIARDHTHFTRSRSEEGRVQWCYNFVSQYFTTIRLLSTTSGLFFSSTPPFYRYTRTPEKGRGGICSSCPLEMALICYSVVILTSILSLLKLCPV